MPLHAQVKRHAAKVAAAGYRVLVPDLYKGAIGGACVLRVPISLSSHASFPVDKEEASHHMGALDWAAAVKEIAQAAAFLKAEGSPKVGATGFCMGGALTLLGAATCPDISCAAPFYGIPRDERVDLGKLDKPVLVRAVGGGQFCHDCAMHSCASCIHSDGVSIPGQAHFGELDDHKGFSDPESAKALAAKLPRGEVHLVPGQGHGFMNDTPEPYGSFEERRAAMGMVPYDAGVVEGAWARVFAFFGTHLK